MPSGKSHLKVELAAFAAIALAAAGGNALWEFANWQDQFQPLALIFVLAYLFSSLLLSPDLDLARSDPHNRWGLLRHCWKPYAKLFRHRGLSHNPLLGPLSRLVYLGLWAAAVLILPRYLFAVEIEFLRHWWENLHGAALWTLSIGLVLPNEIHILLDQIYNDTN